MRAVLTLILTLAATGASAHPGHLADLAGHGHWVGAAAIGLAIALGLWAGKKGDDKAPEPDASDNPDEEQPA